MIKTEFYQTALDEIKHLNTPDFVVDYKAEPYFKVNLNTREVIVPADFRNIGVKGDHNAETIWFAVDRWFDGVDLYSQVAGIQYELENGDKSMLPFSFAQLVGDDGDTDKTEGDRPVIMLGFKITKDLTAIAGRVELTIRFYQVGDGQLTYNISTLPFSVWVSDGQDFSDESQGMVPSSDALTELVQKINALYENEDFTALDYNNIMHGTLPILNGVKIKGDLYTNYEVALDKTGKINDRVEDHYIPISYKDLKDRPTINGVEIFGDKNTSDYKFSYEDLESIPMINGKPLIGNKTDAELGIKVTVDSTLDEDSVNPVQNKVISAEFAKLWEEMDGMTFIPLSISSFDCEPKLAEKGNTVNDVHFTWTIGGNPVKLTINENDMVIGSFEGDLTNLNLKADTDFTLYAEDKKGNPVSKTIQLLFTNKVFHGVAEDKTEFDGSFLDSLTGVLQTSRDGNINVTANENQYIYYASPSEYGDCIFTSGGFTGGFKKVATISYTNQFGVAADYDIWKSDYANLGATNIVIS